MDKERLKKITNGFLMTAILLLFPVCSLDIIGSESALLDNIEHVIDIVFSAICGVTGGLLLARFIYGEIKK